MVLISSLLKHSLNTNESSFNLFVCFSLLLSPFESLPSSQAIHKMINLLLLPHLWVGKTCGNSPRSTQVDMFWSNFKAECGSEAVSNVWSSDMYSLPLKYSIRFITNEYKYGYSLLPFC